MRYLIDHVLQGMAHHQQQRITEQQDNLVQTRQKLADAKLTRQSTTVKVAEYLAEEGTRIINGAGRYESGIGYGDTRQITEELQRMVYHVPSARDLANMERELEAQGNQLERLKQGDTGTSVEVFLRTIQAGGETHVSAHGLKQAGYDPKQLSRYIMAYATAQKTKEA